MSNTEATTEASTKPTSNVTTMLCPSRMSGPFVMPEHDTWRDDNTCSYCGSLNPDAFMQGCEDGTITLGPTDKSTKVYVHFADNPDRYCKFYFEHLSREQGMRFVELYNDKVLKFREPGYFYAKPYFMASVGK